MLGQFARSLSGSVSAVAKVSSAKSLHSSTKAMLFGRCLVVGQGTKPMSSVSAFNRTMILQSSDLIKPQIRTVTGLSTKGDQELVEFLSEEITAETKAQKNAKLPQTLNDFNVEYNGASVTLSKTFKKETITIKFNVNHTVDADVEPEDVTQPDKQSEPMQDQMKSKPSFVIEINKAGRVLMFACSFVPDMSADEPQETDQFNDLFNIDEVSVYEGEIKENSYVVSGDIMDGYLYDLLVNMLEERGISNEFADKLINVATSYEHKLYIDLLSQIKAFVSE